jgi:hypothetical protein
MKTILTTVLLCLSFAACDTLKLPTGTYGTPVTEGEAAQGIKEALAQGVSSAVLNLNKTDGFFGNELYKLLMPPDAQKIVNTLNNLGMSQLVDKAVLAINRGAEDAVGYAKPVFVDAIKQMTIMEAINIVKGSKDAATQYFKDKTTQKLIAAFMPAIRSSLEKVNATKYYGDVVNTYNNFPTTLKKINPDLPSYVAGKAVDALFDKIAKEEENIRANPLARTTDILKRVFGNTTF